MNYHSNRYPKTIHLILVGAFLIVLFLMGCKEEPRPPCLDFGDNPQYPSDPNQCIPKEF